MFRKFLSLSAGVLALFCGTGVPVQMYAQGPHDSLRPGGLPKTNRRSSGQARRFTDPRIGGFSPGLECRLLALRFSGFIPGLDPLFIDPRFGRRLLDHHYRRF
jgi:hypothetical protein